MCECFKSKSLGSLSTVVSYNPSDTLLLDQDGQLVKITVTDVASGVAGSVGRWYEGSGAPISSLGNQFDMYLNITNSDIYQKGASNWGSPIVNIKGSIGNTGSKGDTGNTGSTGAAGSKIFTGTTIPDNSIGSQTDIYIRTNTGDVYQKGVSTWGSILFNIVGPKGDKGDTGDAGTTGSTGTRGSLWYSNSGNPGTITGVLEGDYYINTTNGEVWKYISGVWTDQTFSVYGTNGAINVVGSEVANAVTINSTKGTINTAVLNDAAGSSHTITLTNSSITNTSRFAARFYNYAGAFGTNGVPILTWGASGSGSIVLKIYNTHASTAFNGIGHIDFEVNNN